MHQPLSIHHQALTSPPARCFGQPVAHLVAPHWRRFWFVQTGLVDLIPVPFVRTVTPNGHTFDVVVADNTRYLDKSVTYA